MGKKKKKVDTVGVRSGLLWAIISLLLFFALRYGLEVSLLFATVCGFSVCFILRWWQSEEGPQAKLHPFAKLQRTQPKQRYPGLKDIAERQNRRSTLNKRRQR